MSKKLLFSKLFLSFALCIAFATSCDRSKEIAPVSEVSKPSVTRNDKNGSNDLYTDAFSNAHLRNAITKMLDVSLHIKSLTVLYNQSQLDEAKRLYQIGQNDSENLPIPLGLPLYDDVLCSQHRNYIEYEFDAFCQEIPAFLSASTTLTDRIMKDVSDDIKNNNPQYGVESACHDAVEFMYKARLKQCGSNQRCRTVAFLLFALGMGWCDWGHN